MVKEGDLWDDSALINAFDDAISKYKVMHCKKKHENSVKEGKAIGNTDQKNCTDDIENQEARRDAGEDCGIEPTTAPVTEEASNVSNLKEDNSAKSHSSLPILDSLDSLQIQDSQDVHNGYTYQQAKDEYNQLLSQYNDLEEKRLKVLEQLNQLGGWNYQYPSGGSHSGIQPSNFQEHAVSACQNFYPCACSCCPYVCHCMVAPCTQNFSCSLGATCGGKSSADASVAMVPSKPFSYENGKIVETAMGAAEKAISSIRTKASADSSINEDKKENRSNSREKVQSYGIETDLSDVLNAWYSAGFYTGKFMVEQSIANRQHS